VVKRTAKAEELAVGRRSYGVSCGLGLDFLENILILYKWRSFEPWKKQQIFHLRGRPNRLFAALD
jgi:hypothetical protein